MTMKLDAKQSDVMSRIVDGVIAAMENGTAPWQKPWANRNADDWPTNLQTGKRYRGLNSLYLSVIGGQYSCDYWVGFGQAKKLGGCVRKGETSTQILAPIMRKGEDKKTGETFMFPAGFRVVSVFNAMQCDGLTLPTVAEFEPRTIDTSALDSFFADTGADIVYGGDRACFIPSLDQINIPEPDQFNSAGGFYGTVLHELTHWTGHKSRLDRSDDRSKRGYAFEELIAELGAYYASEKIGCPNEAENHASYLEGWLKALQDDKEYLWKAAAAAERAANYLIATVDKTREQRGEQKLAA